MADRTFTEYDDSLEGRWWQMGKCENVIYLRSLTRQLIQTKGWNPNL
jgi:hypothetical protein